MYEVIYRSQAKKALKRVQAWRANRIRSAIKTLAVHPEHNDLDIKKLSGREGYRMRVGDYRVLFDRDDEIKIIAIEKIGPRGDVYK